MIYNSTESGKDSPLITRLKIVAYLHGDCVESLLTAKFKQEGVHGYYAQVQPIEKVKTDEVKEYQDLFFLVYSGAHVAVLHAHERVTSIK